MLKNPIAMKYAQAIFELAEDAQAIDEIGRDLCMVADTIEGQRDLAIFLDHPSTPRDAKKEVVMQIFAAEVGELTQKILLYLIDKRRETMLADIAQAYKDLTYEARGIIEAHVRSAMALTESEAVRLTQALKKRSGKEVVLTQSVDPSLLGGLVVQMGDTLLDGSVKRQLAELKDALMQADFGKSGVTDEL